MNRSSPDPGETEPPASEWVRSFALAHIERFPRSDWPEAPKAALLFEGWAIAFDHRKITRAEAEAASARMMADAPVYIDAHLTRLIEIIDSTRGTMQNHNRPTDPGPPLTPEEEEIVQQIVTTPFWWRELGKLAEPEPVAAGQGEPPPEGKRRAKKPAPG